ncbi:MAG TPA: phenylalanine--tRNA ligase subunit beta [Candidatus Moranbacteria bacterium]|nr:phenylalanine--tRNA ligase subunit beta [Candidatus Moranbacteria bacterium]HBT45685.1 phenylalanine--tRNA ligase subunit beta [Candidatus Moranbacteria bacterium]
MKYSYNWLKEISATEKSPKELAQLLMLHAFEVEGIEENENKLDGVVVGEILEISKHPNADKLQLVKVNIGKEILNIVCGANNISVGDKVPVATVGSILPGNFKIKESEIRGEKSYGMLCAEDELGLGTSHAGILLLEKESEIGQPISTVFDLDDAIIEIDILANRAHDALSHVGMGREIAALEGNSIDYDYDGLVLSRKKTDKLSVKIEDKTICTRYIGAVLEDIKVCDSPQWLKSRLQCCGIRPINNIVDATNYVMLEIGQPLHAFDFDKISNGKKAEIIIRKAKKDEEIIILDGTTKKLSNDDIVIANPKNALALAGIMGGLDTGVSDQTKNIVLEAATFDPASIRKTRMNLGISSDAALRFEKDIDPNIAEKAMVRVIEILEHIAEAKFVGSCDEYASKKNTWEIKLDLAYLDKLLGTKVPFGESKKILSLLGIKVSGSGNVIKAQIPTFRLDLATQEDLIEEIGRIYGYEKILPQAPLVSAKAAPINEKRVFTRAMKNILVGLGFSEIYNYSFYSQKDAAAAEIGTINHLELEAPMNPEQTLLRQSLIPNILKNVKENLKNFKELHIFEIGHIYLPTEKVLPTEKEILVGAMVVEKKSSKSDKQDLRYQSSFFDAKAVIDKMLSQLGIIDHYYDVHQNNPVESSKKIWHQTRSGEIKITGSGITIGYIGEISPFVLERFDVNARVVAFEFDMEKVREISEAEREYTPIRKHPIVTRDISLLAQKDVRIDEILMVIQSAGKDFVQDVDLFDAIDFADDTSSFAFHIILGAQERTLTGKEIDDVMLSITNKLEKDLNVKMRR